MQRHEIVLIVWSVIGSAFAFALPLVTMLWRAFSTIAELKLQIVQNRNDLLLLSNKMDHIDDRWESATAQTGQKFDHFSNRLRGEVIQLNMQVRELQNYLSKTTSFEVRSSGSSNS